MVYRTVLLLHIKFTIFIIIVNYDDNLPDKKGINLLISFSLSDQLLISYLVISVKMKHKVYCFFTFSCSCIIHLCKKTLGNDQEIIQSKPISHPHNQ